MEKLQENMRFDVVFFHENMFCFLVILCASSSFTPHYIITDKGGGGQNFKVGNK